MLSSNLSGAALVPSSPSGARSRSGCGIRDELTCPICLDIYKLPTTIPCGHTFCRYCISRTATSDESKCPMCRLPIGRTLSINTVLLSITHSSLVVAVQTPSKLGRAAESSSFPQETVRRLPYLDQRWWTDRTGREWMPLPTLIRNLMVHLRLCMKDLLARDFATCLTDLADTNNLWKPCKYMIDLEGAQFLVECMRKSETPGEGFTLSTWVESYVVKKPHVIAVNSSLGPDLPNLYFRIIADKPHRVDGALIRLESVLNNLPWVGGRFAYCDLKLTHTSVSLYHFMMLSSEPNSAREKSGSFLLMDCGSSVGTMIKLKREEDLENGWRIHLADHLELDVVILSLEATLAFHLQSDGAERSHIKVWDAMSGRVALVALSTVVDVRSGTWIEDPRYIPIPLMSLWLVPWQDEREASQWSSDKVGRTEFIVDPMGAVLGRGPTITVKGAKKIVITETNGYVSREHTYINFGLGCNLTPSWRLRDISSLGTYRKLSPLKEQVEIRPGMSVKVGQCKMELMREEQLRSAVSYKSYSAMQPGEASRFFNVPPIPEPPQAPFEWRSHTSRASDADGMVLHINQNPQPPAATLQPVRYTLPLRPDALPGFFPLASSPSMVAVSRQRLAQELLGPHSRSSSMGVQQNIASLTQRPEYYSNVTRELLRVSPLFRTMVNDAEAAIGLLTTRRRNSLRPAGPSEGLRAEASSTLQCLGSDRSSL